MAEVNEKLDKISENIPAQADIQQLHSSISKLTDSVDTLNELLRGNSAKRQVVNEITREDKGKISEERP